MSAHHSYTARLEAALEQINIFKDDQKNGRTLDWGWITLAEQSIRDAMKASSTPEWDDDEWIDFYAGLHPAKIVGTKDPMVTHEYYDLSQLKTAFLAGKVSSKNAAPQVPTMATSGASAEVDSSSTNLGLESATSAVFSPADAALKRVWICQDVVMYLRGVEAQAGNLADAISLFQRFEREARLDATKSEGAK
jgi:hypothetical protein